MIWFRLSKLSIIALIPLLVFFLIWITPAHAFGSTPDGSILSATDPTIGMQQATTPTTLTVEIISSPWVPVDSNGAPTVSGGGLPNVYVVAARVTNTGTVVAENVMVTLDYQEVLSWTLLSGEDPVRIVDSLGAGETYHAYWFARYPQAFIDTHQYTVSAQADNATLVSTSENVYDPSNSQTVETRSTQGTANQGLTQSSVNVTVGVAFTMTQEFNLGQNPDEVVFGPVGNPTFDPSAYRLLSVEGEILDSSMGVLEPFTDVVYLENLDGSAEAARITYTFLALLPSDTEVCPYSAILFGSVEKYDQYYCLENDDQDTVFEIDGNISFDLNKSVDLVQVEQGQILQYTIAYTNTGDKPLTSSWIWDELPANTTLLTGTISPANDEENTTTNQVAWKLGNIPATGDDSSGILSFSALVDGGVDIPDGENLVNSAYFGINPGTIKPANKAMTSTTTSIVQAPVVAIRKSDGADTANPGDSLTYVIQITNTGSISASDIVVVDKLPAGVLLNGTPNPALSNPPVGQTLTWDNLSDIAPSGGMLEITIPVRVNPELSETGTLLSNVSDITFKNSTGYTFATKTASDVTTVVVPVAELELSKTGEDLNGAPLVVSDTIRYTLQVTNTGTFTAYNVIITDTLPSQVTCQSVSDSLSCANPLTWNAGNLAANGGTASLTIDVTVNSGTEGQSIINSASVTATNVVDPPEDPETCPDGNLPNGNNCGSTPEGNTQLLLSKTAEDVNGGDLLEGDTLLYTLQVTNTGTYTAYNVVVTDDLPDQVNCQSVGNTLSCADPLAWNVGNLSPIGGTASLTIEVAINSGTAGQSIINSASVTATNVVDPPENPEVCPDGSPPNGDTCDETPTGVPSLSLAKLAEDLNGAPLVVSDTIRYTLQVTNTGTFTAYNVVVTDTLPSQITCQSVSDGLSCANPLVWNVGDLAANGGADSLTIDVTVNSGTEGQSIINSASVTSTNVVDPPENPEVCPDGSPPNGDTCDETPSESEPPTVYLPIVLKNN